MTSYYLSIYRSSRPDDQPLQSETLPGSYATVSAAMRAAKKAAGRGAEYWGDRLSVRYAGPAGTVYVCEHRRAR